jgi:hypothetical protein
MIDNPNELYTGPDDPKPAPKVKAQPQNADQYLKWRENSGPNMSRAGASFQAPGNVTQGDYKKYFGDTGVYDPALTGNDISLTAGERQTWGEKLARRAGTFVPNVLAGLVDMVGYTGALLTEWGDNRDYSNGLTEAAQGIREWSKENIGGTYRRDNSTWALNDPTWWIDNVFDTGEWATSFAIGGAGIGKLLGGVGKGLSMAANLGTKGSRLVMGAAQLGTSGLVSYAEAAQAGGQVFSEVYQHQLGKALAAGLDPQAAEDHAKHIAAQSAATTAQLGTLLTMGINVGAYAPLFRSQTNVAKEIIGKRLAQLEGGSFSNIATALRGMNASDYMDKLLHHKGIAGMLEEMTKEGGEEFLQQFAQQTGTDMGNEGKMKGFFSQFGELENLVNRTANSEGMLAFTLGAAFGGLQHGLLHNVIPSKRVEKLSADGTPIQRFNSDGSEMLDKQGNPMVEKHWVTPRKYEHDFTQQSFNSVRDAVAADFEHHSTLETEYLAALKKKDPIAADEARDRMFDPTRLHAIKQGMTEPWIKTFQQIADMDNEQVDPQTGQTEAMARGYADQPGTTLHKEAAEKTIEGIKHLSSVYEGLNQTYNTKYEGNEHIQPLVDMVFAREADLYSQEQRIDKYRKLLTESETKEQQMAQVLDPEGFSKNVHQYLTQHNSAREVEKQLVDDHKELMKGDPKSVARLLRKYRAVGMGDGKTAEPVKVLDEKLRRKQEEVVAKVKATEDALFNSPEYNKWLERNPDGKFDGYLKEVNERNNLSSENRLLAGQIEGAQAQLDIARSHLSEMTREKNAVRFSKKVGEWQEQLRKDAETVEKQQQQKLAEMTKDKTTLTRLQKIGLNRIAEGYRLERDKVLGMHGDNLSRLADLQKELKETFRDPMRSHALRRQIKQLTKENEILQARSKKLDTLYAQHKVDLTPEEAEVPVEDVTGEVNGKNNVDASEEPTTATTNEPNVQLNETPEDLLSELEGASPLAEMTEDTSVTIEDELEALRKELEEASPVDSGIDPLDHYAQMVGGMTPLVKARMESIVQGLVDGTHGFSLDLLNQEVKDGSLTIQQAHNLLLAARDYADEITRLQTDVELSSMPGEFSEPEVLPQVLVNGIGTPDTPLVNNADPLSAATPQSLDYHAGFKIIEAATTGATSTIGYDEGTRKGKNGETMYVKVTKPHDLLRPASEDILKPGKLLPGHDIRYEVDVDYDGPKHITDSLSWDENGEVVQAAEKGADYLDHQGKVKAGPRNVGNVPIRVVDAKTGKFLFHIRKLDWLHAKFPNTKDYRNVVDQIQTKEGVIDNLDIQTQKLMEIRTAIVEKFNREGKHTDGKIAQQGKGTGRLILNHVIEEKDAATKNIKSKVVNEFAHNRKHPEKSMLPDKSLELVIVGDGGALHSGHNFQFNKPLGITSKDIPKGGVGAMVPAANGKFMYAPLIGMKLQEEGKPSSALNSVARAIELYLLNDGTNPEIGHELDSLESNTGFNVGTTQGLRSFINQYFTYLQGFQDAALSPNATTGIKAEQFLFNVDPSLKIADKTKQIKAGFTMRGDGARYANLLNGKLDPAFLQVLAEGFATRSRAVVFTNAEMNLKGINSQGKFYDAVYTPGKGWKHNEYESYNQYVKSFSRTPVYGRNQLGDGTYVYTANPHLNIETPDLRHNATLVEPAQSTQSVKPVEEKTYKADVDLFDQLGSSSLRPMDPHVVQAFGTGSENSRPLDVKTLEEIYNFTAEAERNGKTVLEVYEDLTSRGHSYISEGYNPFSRCL